MPFIQLHQNLLIIPFQQNMNWPSLVPLFWETELMSNPLDSGPNSWMGCGMSPTNKIHKASWIETIIISYFPPREKELLWLIKLTFSAAYTKSQSPSIVTEMPTAGPLTAATNTFGNWMKDDTNSLCESKSVCTHVSACTAPYIHIALNRVAEKLSIFSFCLHYNHLSSSITFTPDYFIFKFRCLNYMYHYRQWIA